MRFNAILYLTYLERGAKVELFSKSWRKCTESQGWVLMLEFFFDDSGQESWVNEQFICIAGYLAWDQSGTALLPNGVKSL